MGTTSSRGSSSSGSRKVGELERLGADGMDYLVLGVDAPGFEQLTAGQRTLSYWLYRAAVAGDRIYTDQNHRHALEIQELLEATYVASEGLEEGIRAGIHEYLKYLWINHGQYDGDNHTKIVPRLMTPATLAEAARFAAARGGDMKLLPGEDLEAKLTRLAPHIFDAQVEPLQSNEAAGADVVATSAVNLYDPLLTSAMLDALSPEWRERLNVRFAHEEGRVVPQVYRVGGRYGSDLETVVFFLERAAAEAESEEQRDGLRSLIEHYTTGDEEAFRRYSVHWLRSSTTVDYLNGFIEQYNDPRGVIGQFEANVSFVADSVLIGRLADSATYFEQRMPWPDRYKRTRIERPVANVVNVIVETGDAGPMSPAAYNLPNYADLRRDHGSKNIVLNNIESARSPRIQEDMYAEFYLPRFRDNIRRHFDDGRKWLVYMHEVIGHGSGQAEPDLASDPRALIGRAYSALEECRSDLVALYHICDPRLVEIGAFDAGARDGVVEAAYMGYLQGHMNRYRSIPSETVREAHRRGAELILQYLTRGGESGERDFGVRIVRERGDYFVDLTSVEKARDGVAEILRTLQTIKSTGNGDAAIRIFERFGTHLDPGIWRNIRQRSERLRIPRATAFVFPRLEPVVRDGRVVDATLHVDEDLTAQQLRLARMRLSRSIP